MQIIVNRTKATRRVTDRLITLHIGANEFSEADTEYILADPYFQECYKRGLFKVEAAPAIASEIVHEPGDLIPNLRLLKIGEALKAVRECDNIKVLDTWLHQDGRKTVRDAILKRGIQITDKTPKDDTDADDTSDLDYPVVGG